MKMQTLALAYLAATAIGGMAWVFLYPLLSGERKAEARRASISRSEPAFVRQAEESHASRREQVEGSLKELEARRQQDSKVPLSVRISQAGLDWSIQKFWTISGIVGSVFFVGTLLFGGGLLRAICRGL